MILVIISSILAGNLAIDVLTISVILLKVNHVNIKVQH